jgi:alpha-beta hydrolase superfamily lysophospholipase
MRTLVDESAGGGGPLLAAAATVAAQPRARRRPTAALPLLVLCPAGKARLASGGCDAPRHASSGVVSLGDAR